HIAPAAEETIEIITQFINPAGVELEDALRECWSVGQGWETAGQVRQFAEADCDFSVAIIGHKEPRVEFWLRRAEEITKELTVELYGIEVSMIVVEGRGLWLVDAGFKPAVGKKV